MPVYNPASFAPGSSTMRDFIESLYIPWARTNKRSYSQADAIYLKPLSAFFGDLHLSEINLFLIERYKRERLATPTIHGRVRKPASVNRELECLSRILSYAVECQVLESNPARKVRKLKQDNQRYRYLSRAEESALVEALQQSPVYLQSLVVLAIETGMRRGELLELQWEQIDLNLQTIYIKRSKSGRPRVIPISRRALVALDLVKKTSGAVYGRICFKRSWSTALKRAGIKDFRFHDLRHTAATRWAERGADVYVIAALLGHHCLQTTMRYAHGSMERMRDIVNQE